MKSEQARTSPVSSSTSKLTRPACVCDYDRVTVDGCTCFRGNAGKFECRVELLQSKEMSNAGNVMGFDQLQVPELKFGFCKTRRGRVVAHV